MISVIVPVYNVEKYLHICINSILNQTYQNFEIICIDDASTDFSSEILRYFEKKDSRIKIIRNETNIGLGPSRNKGMDAAKGKYVLFLDSDDWYDLEALETFFNKAEDNNLDVVIAKTRVYYENQQIFGNEKHYDVDVLNQYDNDVFNHLNLDKELLFKIPFAVWNKLYLKSFLDDNNIRFPNFNCLFEDNPFSSKVITSAERISFINRYCYNRRRREGSLMTLNNSKLFDSIDVAYLILEVFLDNDEIYERYKKDVLNYIFGYLLNEKYHQIENQYKEKFYMEAQGIFKSFINDYELLDDIKENVRSEVLDFFKFEDIVSDLFSENSK